MAEDPNPDHMQRITDLSRPGQPLAPSAPTATINNPEWFGRLPGRQAASPTPDRLELHKSLITQVRNSAPDVEQDRMAVVLAGPPGAGKSTVRKSVLGDDDQKYLVIDADDFKAALLDQARKDGSYEDWIKPDAVKELEANTGETFYPMELASLVHEESSMLAKQLRADSLERGDNLVVDTVLSNAAGAVQLGSQLQKAGYEVRVIDVEVPYEVSEQRIRDRWLEARQEAEQASGQSSDQAAQPLGGRWVPSEYTRDVFDGPDGRSKPSHAAEQLAEQCPNVTRYQRFYTSAEGAQKTPADTDLQVDKGRAQHGGPLKDTAVLQAAQRRGANRPHLQHSTQRPRNLGSNRGSESGPER